MNRMTAKEYQALIQTPRPSKYKNVKTQVDGILFDSKREAERYIALQLLQQSGEIDGFATQPSFLLPGKIRYRPDFIVSAKGRVWVEDVKGLETEAFRLKKRLWKEAYPWLELKIIR